MAMSGVETSVCSSKEEERRLPLRPLPRRLEVAPRCSVVGGVLSADIRSLGERLPGVDTSNRRGPAAHPPQIAEDRRAGRCRIQRHGREPLAAVRAAPAADATA